ncbi:L-seryl-tRNA(Sec) selenium transferase [Gilliamella sp. wkB178]|uniref:L-seryl-tRNA(Sec) selenium transferase n=1 Tax=Gilliamella sp. wkB178 TaxID=3120259 RepID=UPI00080E6BD4|nr:L-seryl-tRNA(Sec) selenium transferase [Gilliamella apicola]OCG06512.1 L-seryl-tRNA(Sec) selenium transferase [Gilliamella apicola]
MRQLSQIPPIEKLLNLPEIEAYFTLLSRTIVAEIVKTQVKEYRNELVQTNQSVDITLLLDKILVKLAYQNKIRIQPIINATGIVVHTNLGRSPLPKAIWQEVGDIVCNYSNLELNLLNGKRGNRMGLLNQVLQAYFGGESSIIVNNNAAALHLILKTFAEGKEVIVSRGEQIQIGGGFRIPDILADSGAILRDVGTTNITTIDDYLNAINDNTAIVLIVHQSNYYIEGFSQHVDIKQLAANLPEHVMLVIDQGSGNHLAAIPSELSVNNYLKIEPDLICFSGDKILGGPQSGIILGKKDKINKLSKHPMMRVLRPGKETYALLEKILIHRLNRDGKADNSVELLINQPLSWHLARAKQLADIAPEKLVLKATKFMVGGGSTPRAQFDTWAISINSNLHTSTLIERLRNNNPPIIGVIQNDQVLLYPVTLSDEELSIVKDYLTILTTEIDF